MMQALLLMGIITLSPISAMTHAQVSLTENETFSTAGLDYLVFNNWYDGTFSDAKIAAIEIIHHDVRVATNGDVRLSPTPMQWDPTPAIREKRVLKDQGSIEVDLGYPQHQFNYTIRTSVEGNALRIALVLDQALPEALVGKAGFNLEFLPARYFSKSFLMDDQGGHFPLHPRGPSARNEDGSAIPMPLASGKRFVLAPEDPERRISVDGHGSELMLLDGRNQAQNGWFVIRSLIPASKTGTVIEWTVEANVMEGWTRPTVIAHSQVGYHPKAAKTAVLERDPRSPDPEKASLLKLDTDGAWKPVFSGKPEFWGKWLRYSYFTFDFSSVRENGLYAIEADGKTTHAFRIDERVYDEIWHPTLDVYFPVQMDHMRVREGYRIWHGLSHMDDALQAPVDNEHFDLFRMGSTTDTRFKPGEHIPGLNIGGWYDAGDFDIRTQSQYATVQNLVMVWETFRPTRDETTVSQERKRVWLHQPDGVPDILQQIEHGTLGLLAQHRAVGHAIPGIVEPDLKQYTHLGDGSTKTDGLIYDASLGLNEEKDGRSGLPDDRWAFTTNTSALNYGSAAALAAASRALKGYRDELAEECLQTALKVWEFEKNREPNRFFHGNTTGGFVEDERLEAALELLLTTGDNQYANAIRGSTDSMGERFPFNAAVLVRAIPHMDEAYRETIKQRTIQFLEEGRAFAGENPFGVPITRGGWAGNGMIMNFAVSNYLLHRAFPDIVGPETTFKGLDYLLGCHPGSNESFVSAVGAHSRDKAYGNNRADFSFIAGGIVPGVLVLKPDFPESKSDWPFFWGQNEYVITMGAPYIFLAHAVADLAAKQ